MFYDFETGSRNKYTTQPIQLAAVAIDGRRLEIMQGGEFNTLMRPILDDAAAIAAGLDPIEDEALKINGHTREELALPTTPDPKIAWEMFVEYVNRFNYKKTPWTAPIGASFNGDNFDNEIIRRLCKQYGPYDDKYQSQKLFHPFNHENIMRDVFQWTENNTDIKSISMDSVREWLGISKDGAHNALKDVLDGAAVLIKFLKLYRYMAPRVKFENSFGKKVEPSTDE